MTDYFIAIVMSVIQGLTEFLPISSSAHLLIPSLLFGITDLGLNFDIAVHFGTLTAVVFYFRDDIVKIFNSFYNIKDVNLASYRKLGLFVLIASIPAIIIGPFLISIGGKGVALAIFLFLVILLSLSKLIVEIRLIIFLFFENFNLGNILLPTLGVTPNNITEDLSIIS